MASSIKLKAITQYQKYSTQKISIKISSKRNALNFKAKKKKNKTGH